MGAFDEIGEAGQTPQAGKVIVLGQEMEMPAVDDKRGTQCSVGQGRPHDPLDADRRQQNAPSRFASATAPYPIANITRRR
ncbi:hypothetical protein [Micromonospora sp. NPDC005324]|uniref:hypothetical protein n=1 Tax=Micromonospora sp. NPDC005324 TaxID=3157033 RepID=UPI0033B54265